MNNFLKILTPYAFAGGMLIILFFVFRPVTISRENCIEVKALLTAVTPGSNKDIVFSLAGVRGVHYINRGTEHGLNADSLREHLLNKEVEVFYLKPHWLSGLSPMTDSRHITELKSGGKTIYTELN